MKMMPAARTMTRATMPTATPTAAPVLNPFFEPEVMPEPLDALEGEVGTTVTVLTVPSAVTVETVGAESEFVPS